MTTRLRRYLDKRANLARWPLAATDTNGIDAAVVIPVLAEKDYLFQTLASLAGNAKDERRRTLVVCSVNNRDPEHTEPERIAENSDTLARLDAALRDDRFPLRLAYVDASSPGREMPAKGGVGLARKIGLDAAADVLERNGASDGVLMSLDGDSPVATNYLPVVRNHFVRSDAWAAVVEYEHPLDGDDSAVAAIVAYECYLRYHSLGLALARSPYAYPAIGSTMVCRADAYAAISGMNKRQGGEDFYFLQELAKTSRVDRIFDTRVYPSSRASTRVPLGTGQNVLAYLEGHGKRETLYHPDSYRIAGAWIECVGTHLDANDEQLMQYATAIAPSLARYLEETEFPTAWQRLQSNARNAEQLAMQFHRWFDGFRTLMLLHHLRRDGYPEQEAGAAIASLLRMYGVPVDVASPRRDLLLQLREADRASTIPEPKRSGIP